jgi:hypothetical protein
MDFADKLQAFLQQKKDHADPWTDFKKVDAQRVNGELGPDAALQDRFNEGRAIASMFPPGIGPGIATAMSAGYEGAFKPLVANVPELNDLMPYALKHVKGLSSEPSFREGLRRVLATARGGVDQNLRDLWLR